MTTPGQTPEATTGKAKSSAPAKSGTIAAVTYLGPDRAYGLPITRNTIFAQGIPPFCAAKAKEAPHFAACFVPTGELGKAMADMKKTDSAMFKNARKVAEETVKMNSAAGIA